MSIQYTHQPHQHIEARKQAGPPKTRSAPRSLNAKIAIVLTSAVGSMWCAYVFALLALVALPGAIHDGLLQFVQWVSQTFIQLVMLSVIMVGQSIMGLAADKRAEMTYNDAEATFHEAKEIQMHLQEQDAALNTMLERLERLEAEITRQAELSAKE